MKVSGGLVTAPIPGPFEVEIKPSDSGKSYDAFLLPTRQKFVGLSSKKIDEVESKVTSLFEKVESAWKTI